MVYIITNEKLSLEGARRNPKALELKSKTLRAVIYARVSSKEQSEKKFSIPKIQIPQSKELLKEKGWRFVNCYVDGGCDGNTFLNRPNLQKMLTEDIDTYDVIVVWSFDRLTRDDSYTEAKIYNILDSRKKQVTSVLQRTEIVNPEEYDPKSLNVATHRRLRSIGVAYDSLSRRERFMASREATVMKGKHISEPSYGYKMIRRIDPKDPRRTIGYRTLNKEEVPILKRIFKERVFEGKSYRQIAFSLNQDLIKTRKGEWWSGPRIGQILKNPFPCGYIPWHKTQCRKYGDENIRKSFPETEWRFIPVDRKLEKYYRPVIGKKLFWRAQELRQKNFKIRGRAVESANILVGLIKCPICQAPMVETGIYKVKKAPYRKGFYQCSKWTNKRLCSRKRYPSWSIKMKVLERVNVFLNDPKVFKEYLKKVDGKEVKAKEMELKNYKRKLERAQEDIKSLNLKYLRGKIKEKYYPSLLQELEEKEKLLKEGYVVSKEEIQTFYQKKEERESMMALSKEIKEGVESLTFNQKKLILRVLIKELIPGKKMKGKGVKGDPRVNNPNIKWNNPAIMEQECAFLKPL